MSDNHKVEVYRDSEGQWRWRRVKSSDSVAVSGEGYHNHQDCADQAQQEADAFGIEWCDSLID